MNDNSTTVSSPPPPTTTTLDDDATGTTTTASPVNTTRRNILNMPQQHLTEQLAVAQRVHYRLLNASHNNSGHVLRHLLPRLLRHVDECLAAEQPTSPDVVANTTQQRQRLLEQYTATIAYGREQLVVLREQEKEDATTSATHALTAELLETILTWRSPVTLTLGVSLLPPVVPPSAQPLLLSTWNRLETKLLQQPQPQQSLHAAWLRLSRMVIDSVVKLSQDVVLNAQNDEALFHLTLDIILYPCCSRVGRERLDPTMGSWRLQWLDIVIPQQYKGERGRFLSLLAGRTGSMEESDRCSARLAIALLTLVMGEGSDAAMGTEDDTLLGPLQRLRRSQFLWCRPPLAAPQRVIDSLLTSFRPPNHDEAITPDYCTLLHMLLAAVSTPETASPLFRLAERVLRALPSTASMMCQQRWRQRFNRAVCNKTLPLLTTAPRTAFAADAVAEAEKRRHKPTYHRDNAIQTYQATRRQHQTMDARCAAYDLWTAILETGISLPCDSVEASSNDIVCDQLLPLFLHCVVHECDRVLQPHALRTLDRCCQHVVLREQRPTPLVSARLVAAVCAPSPVCVRIAAATTWIGALCAEHTAAARHVWQYLAAHDPSPEVRTAATRAMQTAPQQEPTTNSHQQLLQPVHLDRRNELDRHVLQGVWLRTVETIAVRFGLSNDMFWLLLVAARYDVKSLTNALEQDQEATLRRYGIQRCFSASPQQSTLTSPCGICFDAQIPGASACPHDHFFCCQCWHEYFTITCHDALQQGTNVTCPMPDCHSCVSPTVMRSVDPMVASQWESAVFEKFLGASDSLSPCPAENCSGVAMVLNGESPASTVTCSCCQSAYCFQCGSEPHHPASCGAYRKWTQQVINDSSFWVRMNSKPCPQCSVPIEKNTGCNHMVCTQCSANFCWLCLTELSGHLAPHECNSVVAGTNEEQRAQFYTTRYQAHKEAKIFESNRDGKFDQLTFLDEQDRHDIDEACQVLWRARTYLENACVAAWEMSQDESTIRSEGGTLRLEIVSDSRLEMFMNAQSTLALLTEQLSAMTESKLALEKAYRVGGESSVAFHVQSLNFVADTVSKYSLRLEELCLKPEGQPDHYRTTEEEAFGSMEL